MPFFAGFTTVGRLGGGGTIHFEAITRLSAGERVLQEALARVPPVDNSGDADFSFGGPSAFTLTDPVQKSNPSVSYQWPPSNDPKDEPKEVHIAEYDWVSRCWQIEKVVQEDDPDNWVEVKSYVRMVFQGRDDGRLIALNLPTLADK